MPITHWPEEDQPRQKLIKNGPETLTDAELLAIIIQTGIRGKSALDIARSLLTSHPTLKSLVDSASQVTLKGFGTAKRTALQAAIELGKRYLSTPIQIGQKLNDSRKIKGFLTQKLAYKPNEVFACLFMSNHFHLLQYEEVSQGTVNQASIYPREIVRLGIKYNAVKVILAHNHPSGSASPSISDKEITNIIRQTLALVEMVVVDHIIVSVKECFSFAENGLI